jgi:hypothetical protein
MRCVVLIYWFVLLEEADPNYKVGRIESAMDDLYLFIPKTLCINGEAASNLLKSRTSECRAKSNALSMDVLWSTVGVGLALRLIMTAASVPWPALACSAPPPKSSR